MELVIMALVISAFGRGAQISGKSFAMMRLAGGAIYILLLGIVQIPLGIMLGPSSENGSIAIYLAVLTYNLVTIAIVINIAKNFFDQNPFELKRFFRALNAAFIALGIVGLLGWVGETWSELQAVIWQVGALALIVIIFGATLIIELRFEQNSPQVSILRRTLTGANVLLIALAILSIEGARFTHPIAFSFLGAYFSAWLSLVAGINARTLSSDRGKTESMQLPSK